VRRHRGTRRTTRASAGGSRDTLSVGSSRGHSGELQCEAAAGVFADVVHVDDMVNILAGWDPHEPRTLTSWTPESTVNITSLMRSIGLCAVRRGIAHGCWVGLAALGIIRAVQDMPSSRCDCDEVTGMGNLARARAGRVDAVTM